MTEVAEVVQDTERAEEAPPELSGIEAPTLRQAKKS